MAKVIENKKSEPVREPKQGDLFRWISDVNKCFEIFMITDKGATQLSTGDTWEWDSPIPTIKKCIKDEQIELLPSGYSITLEQE